MAIRNTDNYEVLGGENTAPDKEPIVKAPMVEDQGAEEIEVEETVVGDQGAEEIEVEEIEVEETVVGDQGAEEIEVEAPGVEKSTAEGHNSIEAKKAGRCFVAYEFSTDEGGRTHTSNNTISRILGKDSICNYFTRDSISAYVQSHPGDIPDLESWNGIKEVLDYAAKRNEVKGYEPGYNFVLENSDVGKVLYMPNAQPIPIPDEKADKLIPSLVVVQTEEEARSLIYGEDRNTPSIGENNDRSPNNTVSHVDREGNSRNSGEMDR